MKLVIVSGLSGSGKTVALHALEDAGYYCVDNLHPGLLTAFVDQLMNPQRRLYQLAAVGIDARSGIDFLKRFSEMVAAIRARGIALDVVFLQTDVDTLLKRFNETRRKHPLARKGLPLIDAIQLERQLLTQISSEADLVIDTTYTNVHQLSNLVRERIQSDQPSQLSILFQSFGFKHGAPTDSDFVFDVRCLPNPHWESDLRGLTGLDEPVRSYLQGHAIVDEMEESIRGFLDQWVPRYESDNRSYLTVSIGCTGGQHRSVYFAERLAEHFRETRGGNVTLRHRELTL
jgi:UPF0042 nucleotide-binding protein